MVKSTKLLNLHVQDASKYHNSLATSDFRKFRTFIWNVETLDSCIQYSSKACGDHHYAVKAVGRLFDSPFLFLAYEPNL